MEDWKQDQKILLYIPISKSINIMKKHLILTAGLAFTSFGQNIKSQSILDEYKKFDINGSSSEVMYAIENDFRQSPNKDFVILKSNEQLKYPLKNERQVQATDALVGGVNPFAVTALPSPRRSARIPLSSSTCRAMSVASAV